MNRFKPIILCMVVGVVTADGQTSIETSSVSPLYCRSQSYHQGLGNDWHRLMLGDKAAVHPLSFRQLRLKKYRWLNNLWQSRGQRSPVVLGVADGPKIKSLPSPEWAGNDRLCARSHSVASLISPRTPVVGNEIKVLFASDKSFEGARVLVTGVPKARVGLCGIDLEYSQFHVPAVVRGGNSVPNWVVARFKAHKHSAYQVALVKKGRIVHCETVRVRKRVKLRRKTAGVWLTERDWSRHAENLYSAWVEHLFSGGEDSFWDALHDVTRNDRRNLLHNHLGQNEDRTAGYRSLELTPDCADNPLYLRAYFSWKLGLPFGYHACGMAGRGKAADCSPRAEMRHVLIRVRQRAPAKKVLLARARIERVRQLIVDGMTFRDAAKQYSECGSATAGGFLGTVKRRTLYGDLLPFALKQPVEQLSEVVRTDDGFHLVWVTEKKGFVHNESEPPDGKGRWTFQRFVRGLKMAVRSSGLRNKLTSEHGDLYPVKLTRKSLRPGTVFADPHGHVLTLVGWRPQQANSPGRLIAVDAQPDSTVSLKRFWKGHFVFRTQGLSAGPGFKAFRPVVRDKDDKTLRPATNAEINKMRMGRRRSLVQRDMPAQVFYDRIEALINPRPVDPVQAFRDLHKAFRSQLKQRVRAVRLAQTYWERGAHESIQMPRDKAVFQTSGPWEALSTPCRDMRLLIALDTLLDFPNKVMRNPGSFVLNPGQDLGQLAESLRRKGEKWRRGMWISYRRSDGSKQRLNLQHIIERRDAFEMAYNPNDCPEVRWSAPPESEEIRSCVRKAPDGQQRQMEAIRHWFKQRYGCG